MRFRTEDTVLVIKGRDRGKQGRIQQVDLKKGKLLVEGVNVAMRHTKPTAGIRQGGIIQKEMAIQACNVMLVCTHCTKPTRIGHRTLADGTKARLCNRCQEVIE
jgi:large subunit ribosomal protein L24